MNVVRRISSILILLLLLPFALFAQWTKCAILPGDNQGIRSSELIYLTANGSRLFTGHFTAVDSIFYSDDNGTSWQVSRAPVVRAFGIDFYPDIRGMWAINGTIFASGTQATEASQNFFWRSSDNGITWVPSVTQLTNGLTDGPQCLYSTGNTMYGGSGGGMVMSTDNGLTWALADTHLPKFTLGSVTAHVTILSIAGFGNDVFIGLGGDISGNQYGIWHTTLGSSTWDSVGTGLPVKMTCPALITVGTTIFARAGGFGQGIYKSTNKGASWTNVTNGIPGWSGLRDGAQGFFSLGNSLFASSSGGEYVSTDAGASWALINQSGLPATYKINSYAVIGNTMFMTVIAPGSSAVWKRPISEFTAVREIPNAIPNQIALQQNYPNPFNPVTNIRYELPQQSHVALEIVNMLGQVVATLVDQDQHAGTYNATWDGASQSSGVYFSRLTVGSATSIRRMVLMK